MQQNTYVRALLCLSTVISLGVVPALAGQKAHPPKAHPIAPVQAGGPKAKPATPPVHPAHPSTPDHPETHGNKPTTATKSTAPKTDHFATRIENNSQLMSRLQPLIPSGMTLAGAADGFKNEGQFIAALHVSRNLNIPFAQLKAEMVGPDQLSLGQAIHKLRPSIQATGAVKTAEDEAGEDLRTRPGKTKAEDNNDQ